ncbi:MAG: four helix bundle protein, partial [Bacteroidales bacterium]|nr:four helix bundle protein [Bacteroidales bacterium]
MADFRFQDLVIWQAASHVSKDLFLIAERLKKGGVFAFADQLFRATLSITNNIAEGSGSASRKDFAHYLIISRKSIYECANILIMLSAFGIIGQDEQNKLTKELKECSKKIFYFRKTL